MKTKKSIFLTAAPVGATPKYINPLEPKFIANFLLDYLISNTRKNEILHVLSGDGWEPVEAGGIALQSGYLETVNMTDLNVLSTAEQRRAIEELNDAGWLHKDNEWIKPLSNNLSGDNQTFKIKKSTLLLIQSKNVLRKLVLQLTTYGWQVNNQGDLIWPYVQVHSYLPPQMVIQLKSFAPAVLDHLLESTWTYRPAGYWQPGKARSPYLPVTPEKIIEECHHSLREGAAIVHLHTRNLCDEETYHVPGLGAILSISAQTNHIEVEQYNKIIPAILQNDPSAILNLSTSVRGDQAAFESPLRRAHLQPYGVRKIVPDYASFSPGHVLFQTGGGYDNPPQFIEKQLKHFKTHSIRPEVEVFNHTILNNVLTTYKESLLTTGQCPLFMLVAGVDQHKKDSESANLMDDSLIPTEIRQRISSLLQMDDDASSTIAVNLAVESLLPIVSRIRQDCKTAQISILMPGVMQVLLVNVALALDLDGIRVGLEDALTVHDELVPGGIRKALGTYEQISATRLALEARDVTITTSEQLRDTLGIPRQDINVFRAVALALKPYTADVCNASSLPKAAKVLEILAPIAKDYHGREDLFIADILQYLEQEKYDAHTLAQQIQCTARDYGLYYRLFIEEKDRYTDHAYLTFPNVYIPQSLNFARELMHERHLSTSLINDMIKQYSDMPQLITSPMASYRIDSDQFKGPGLRFLEYVTSISSRYNGMRTDVINLEIRHDSDYSATMAVLFTAIRELTLLLREKSQADTKKDGSVWYVYAMDGIDQIKKTMLKDTDLAETISHIDWIVLPSTPTTHYPLGLKLSTGLAGVFYHYIKKIIPNPASFKLLGMTHSGLDENGEPIIEASMLYNRFALNTDQSACFSNYSSTVIYDRLLLPRLVENPGQLAYTSRGQVNRDQNGLPIYQDGSKAKRISQNVIHQLPLLKLLAHSSGITTAQQLDNLLRQDACKLGFSVEEQRALFNRMLVISFASASDVHIHQLGSNVIDITAFNDIRSLAGTTTRDYIFEAGNGKKYLEETLHRTRNSDAKSKYDYAHASPQIITGDQGKIIVRLKNVFLTDDPLRLHDGHSIQRYLECSPKWLREWFIKIYTAPESFGANDIVTSFQRTCETIRLCPSTSNSIKIAVVGMGCSGTFILRMLSKHLKHHANVELLLFEKSPRMGAGLPYGEQYNDDCFIMNMESSLLSGNSDDSDEFLNWLKRTHGLPAQDQHVKRTYMGAYLEELVQTSLALLQQKHISYTIIQDDVTDIKKKKNNYQIVTQFSRHTAERIVLATGHLPKISPYVNKKNYIANPYHALDELRKIPTTASVGILGSKLTAIDIAVFLQTCGIKQIAMFSKSGRLPLVRRARSPKHKASLPITSLKRTLLSFWKTIKKRMSLQDVTYPGFINCKDESARLEIEIQQSSTPQNWQVCLDESKEIIDKHWSSLKNFQKRLFLSKYKGLWMSYRHPMPINNAIIINDMLKTGELQIHARYRSVTPLSTSNAFKVDLADSSFQIDYFIDATGTPSNLRQIDSPLIRNLCNSGFLKQHEIGGVELNNETHELKNMKGVFAIGQLTWGKIFYVSAMERLLIHARIISGNLIASLSKEVNSTMNHIQDKTG